MIFVAKLHRITHLSIFRNRTGIFDVNNTRIISKTIVLDGTAQSHNEKSFRLERQFKGYIADVSIADVPYTNHERENHVK